MTTENVTPEDVALLKLATATFHHFGESAQLLSSIGLKSPAAAKVLLEELRAACEEEDSRVEDANSDARKRLILALADMVQVGIDMGQALSGPVH